MPDSEMQDELAVLRARVYGPDADLDPAAIRRLQELEDARRPPQQSEAVEVPEPIAAPHVPEPGPELEPAREPLARTLASHLRGIRRSTVLILVAVVAFVALVVTSLTLVQRVQSDPLQVGARQVARLGVDGSFRLPDIFRGGVNGDISTQGFQPFLGLRTVVTASGFFGSDSDSPCIAVYPEANIVDPESDSFSGPLIGGCAIGGFAAIAQFSSDLRGFPDELSEAYPDYGFQFVYDRVNHEVVVFASQ